MNKNREQLDNSLFNDFMKATNKADFINLNLGNYQICDENNIEKYLKPTEYRDVNNEIASEIKFENIIFNYFLKDIKMDIQKIRFNNCIFNCDFDVSFNNDIDISYCIFLSDFNKLVTFNDQSNNSIGICFSYIESIVIEPILLDRIHIHSSNIMNMYIDGIPLGRGYECLTRILLTGNHIAYFSFAFDDLNYQKFELSMHGNHYSLKKNSLRILNKRYRKLRKVFSTFPLLNSPKKIYKRTFSKHMFHTSKHLLSSIRSVDYSIDHKVLLKYNVLAYNPNNMLLQKVLIFLSYGFFSPLLFVLYSILTISFMALIFYYFHYEKQTIETLGNAYYFASITFCTIGYGDIVPSNLITKICTCIGGFSGIIFCSSFTISLLRKYFDDSAELSPKSCTTCIGRKDS